MSVPHEIHDIRMNTADLYREETITDRHVGTIRCLVPVTLDGVDDASRPMRFEGQTTLLTPAGALPLNFEIAAHTLAEALDKFPAAAQLALAGMMKEIEELRRERASSLIVPGQGGLDLGNLRGPSGSKLIRP